MRAAPHTDQGYHAQALITAKAGRVNLEQLIDYQSIAYEPLWISETHALLPLDAHWSALMYWRVDDFGETERRLGVGVQFEW